METNGQAEIRLKRLRDAGVTPTMQRLAILECLEETKDHPTADLIFERVRKTHPTIARATVYNTLDALSKVGAILRLTIEPGAARYDADIDPHIHFRCRTCGALLDLHDLPKHPLQKIQGHRVETVRTYAYGVCADCLATAEDDEEAGGGASPTGKNGSKRRSAVDPRTQGGEG